MFGPIPLGLNRYSTINDENKYKSKDHLFIYFQNKNNDQ